MTIATREKLSMPATTQRTAGRRAFRFEAGERSFTTRRELVQAVQAILYGTSPGTALAGADLVLMRALLECHPRAAKKIGAGVSQIIIDVNSEWKGCPMFVVVRTDGTRTEFSYVKCLQARRPDADFQAACRSAVVEDILDVKQAQFLQNADAARRVICPLTGRRVGWDEVHVDHAPPWPFRRIVEAFVAQERLDPSTVAIDGLADGECVKRFADAALAGRFRRFHAAHAHLRIVEASAHLHLPK
jgi:hypothetical protein